MDKVSRRRICAESLGRQGKLAVLSMTIQPTWCVVGETYRTGKVYCRTGCRQNYSQNIIHAVEIV